MTTDPFPITGRNRSVFDEAVFLTNPKAFGPGPEGNLRARLAVLQCRSHRKHAVQLFDLKDAAEIWL
jgi:hypothetical protein